MIDGSKKCKCQLAFELQNLRVYEKPSNFNQFFQGVILLHSARHFCFEVLMSLYLQTIICTQGTICTCCDSILSFIFLDVWVWYDNEFERKENKI